MVKVGDIYLDNSKLPVGSKVKFKEEKQSYTVQASNIAFTVCTKPFNCQKTVLYTIINWMEKIRGPEGIVFGMGAESKEDCEEMLERLTQGETQISYRNNIPLNIEFLKLPDEYYKKMPCSVVL
jgi:hypothetical protein